MGYRQTKISETARSEPSPVPSRVPCPVSTDRAVTDDAPITIRWLATRFNNDPPEKDDGTAWDGPWTIGRVRLETFGPREAQWCWTLVATGRGRDDITTNGWETTREKAKASVEAAYRALLAKHPGTRRA
jgi:hypothetical protein